jgi:glycosyltransferase involved in cell wall biosynthesis
VIRQNSNAGVDDRIGVAGSTANNSPTATGSSAHESITMLLENNPYPKDVRVRAEAQSLVRAGHRVTVVAPRGPNQPRRESICGVDVRRFRVPTARGGSAPGFLLEYLVATISLHAEAARALLRRATVLHIHNPPDVLFAAGAIFRLAGRKVIFDHHDLFPETIEVKFGPGIAARVAALAERLTFAVATHVIVTNTSYAEVAQRRGGKAADEVTIVRNAPPAEWTRLPVRVPDGRLDKVRLAYLGTVASQDGVDGLVPVLAKLRGKLDVELTIIGDGDVRSALVRDFAERGLADQVSWTGWVDAERVPELLANADICVDPAPATDVNQRSTMIKIAEYLALGKPIVAYRLLETTRTAADAACLVTPGDVDAFADAIIQLARDPELRRSMANAARCRAEQLTWEHSEQALLSAYQALRAGGR